MTDLGSLPPSVLVKIATLEQALIGLTTKLEASRRDLQRLRIERRDTVPNVAYDEAGANRESERVLSEWARLDDAIAAQIEVCERQERRLRGDEAVIRACKQYLHDLPAGARLRVVEGRAGDLDDIRERTKAVRAPRYRRWKGSRCRAVILPTGSGATSMRLRLAPDRSSKASVILKACPRASTSYSPWSAISPARRATC